MSGRSPKCVFNFERNTASIVAGAGEAAPSSMPSSQAGAFFVEPLAAIAIAVKCSTHTNFDIQLWGAVTDSGAWYKVSNTSITAQTSFVEEFSCACLKYMYVQIASTSGAGSESYQTLGRGVARKER